MRTLIAGLLIAAAMLSGCATGQAEEPVTKRVPVDASNIAEAQEAGYKIRNEGGRTLYCRKDLNTGTRLKYHTSCLTAAEWTQMQESTRGLVRKAGGSR